MLSLLSFSQVIQAIAIFTVGLSNVFDLSKKSHESKTYDLPIEVIDDELLHNHDPAFRCPSSNYLDYLRAFMVSHSMTSSPLHSIGIVLYQ